MLKAALIVSVLAQTPDGDAVSEPVQKGILSSIIAALVADRFRIEMRNDAEKKELKADVKHERGLNTQLTDALRDLAVKSTEVNVGVRDELRRQNDARIAKGIIDGD